MLYNIFTQGKSFSFKLFRFLPVLSKNITEENFFIGIFFIEIIIQVGELQTCKDAEITKQDHMKNSVHEHSKQQHMVLDKKERCGV